MFRCSHIIFGELTKASTDNELPEDGATAPERVGAVLM